MTSRSTDLPKWSPSLIQSTTVRYLLGANGNCQGGTDLCCSGVHSDTTGAYGVRISHIGVIVKNDPLVYMYYLTSASY